MTRSLPHIIQGGMGVGVSGWPLASAVSRTGQLGVIAGTGLDLVFAHRLQLGDPGGHLRRALAHFPVPGVARRLLDRYFVPGGKAEDARFEPTPVLNVELSRPLEELIVAGNFAEVFLAREGHDHPVGINYMEKIQPPTLPSLYGAMLAGVQFVLMGAGMPKSIPGILDRLSQGQSARLRIDVHGALEGEAVYTHFDPQAFCGAPSPRLLRPQFLPIVSSSTMAKVMAGRASGAVNGFVVEGQSAGGHNAPPRGRMRVDPAGEPIYDTRDEPDLEAIAALGLPFWLAGSFGRPERLVEALALGATGIQVGTPFAFCRESAMDPAIKRRVLEMSRRRPPRVVTDPIASPTGFPFKVLQLPNTISEAASYEERHRVCDVGYLRHAYRKESGAIGWRCPSEPVGQYVRKGGLLEDTIGRKCVCNGLLAAVGLGQIRADGYRELPLVTSGSGVADIARFCSNGDEAYGAQDVVAHLLSGLDSRVPHS